eukprot:724935-Rhodomonas_salina.1
MRTVMFLVQFVRERRLIPPGAVLRKLAAIPGADMARRADAATRISKLLGARDREGGTLRPLSRGLCSLWGVGVRSGSS